MADSAVFSKYELEREKNIKKNEELLASLNLLQQKRNPVSMLDSSRKKFPKQSEKQQSKMEPLRMKLRSRSSNDEETAVSISDKLLQYDKNIPERRTGTNEFVEILGQNIVDAIDVDAVLKRLSDICLAETFPYIPVAPSTERFKELQKYDIPSDQGFLKVVPHRIYSVTFANTSKPLALAGDKWGYLGIWSPLEEYQNGIALTLQPHVRAISKIFSHYTLGNQIVTCSYDGTVRILNLSHALCDTILDREEMLFYDISCMDDGNCFLVASNAGKVLSTDKRDRKSTQSILLHEKKISCVDRFPDQHTFCTCSGDHSVCIWDFRKVSFDEQIRSTPIQALPHNKAVTASRVSPSGKFILTTCYDNYIRVFQSPLNNPTKGDNLLHKIPHNNNTGRWVTPFSAEWDPQSDNLFLCGSMEKPRGIDLFHMGKSLETSRLSQENLTTIIPRLAVHPTTEMIIGGSSSGRVFVFAGCKDRISILHQNPKLPTEC
ncbi:transducin family protein / WD-40 repeat family protein [Galdieria sulphuraria]|uniref:Transducin family protein / WD-40 repeat family protein n=1 Tax=Galdieria sulphuraria TaxID=130081 RepID=M2WXF9_GALSU|nr:transducin family protein / WD-40 repeat family protein [Galdieria sulphuraria]EME28730.1 transducin family protein / WD-40 repeat family protein [Galdieria sulphuraria]|eukprot:XP_005705250.1 transducin family protein / WD-40 repeat family protein [Galdieria sulphuraria]